MKKFSYLLICAIMAFAMVSCTEDGWDTQGPNNQGGSNTPPDSYEEFDETKNYPFISTIPSFVTSEMTDDVLVVLNCTGTNMEGFTGELYAHTGVITDLSTGASDWKYTKTAWGENTPECKLQKHNNNLWTLNIKGGPRAYYGVPATEMIKQLAFVFRSADSSKELKDNGKDIFIDVTTDGLSVMFVSPKDGSILKVGEECSVEVKSQNATTVTLYKNGEQIESTDKSAINYTFTPTVAEDIEFKAVATDGVESIEKSVRVAVLGNTETATRPVNVNGGVVVDGNSATFVLYAPGKDNVIVLGDFNNYTPMNKYMMKRDGNFFWVTVDGFESGVEYGYQYLIDGTLKVGDPYAEKILDPWNDKWISASVYPNLKEYPAEYTDDIVSVFEIDPAEYTWQVTDFDRPAENSLAVYELLVRDFTTERSIDAVTAKLDYIETLGVNAIELMPIQEFDGNDSWGYNPCFYFAPDKAYGTEEAYKRFIDECHKRGIAVILDVVFNHATGQFPYAKMWWNASNNCTASDNPFFNVSATHNFSVFHDFNHLYDQTRIYFRDVLRFWLTEYNVDGFRFDLTKGFVQHPNNYDASGYSAERIEILSDYARTIREVDADAYVIFEHFCDQREEDELYNSVGALCWNNNALGGYAESVMGWYDSGSAEDNFWGVMGDLQNNNWSNDIALVLENGIFVAQDVVFADANKEGCVFKIRKNRNWDTSYGVSNGNKLNDTGVAISLDGTSNVLVNATVGTKYDIYFDANSMTVYVMPDGAKPQSVKTQRMNTRAGGNQSNFAGYKRGRMNNIETHDEERIGYKAVNFGQTWVCNDWSVISKHMQAVYAFHFLTPYPKMMWQFGELGYDFSINANESGTVGSGDEYRTHRKPIRWDYYEDVNRKAVYNAISKVLEFRTSREDIYGEDEVKVHVQKFGDSDMAGKTLIMDNVIMVANFTNSASSTIVNVPASGDWQNLMTGEHVQLGDSYTAELNAHDYIILVR